MKILFFSRLFFPHIGGVEKHVLELSVRLQERGHTVTVVTENSENASEEEIVQGIQVYRIPISDQKKKKGEIWKWVWKHRQIIRDADVVHCHDVFFWYLPFRFLYPEKPVYTTFHGYESYPIRKGAIMMRKLSERLSMGNICIGDFIEKWYETKPTIVSYGAVHIPESTSSEEKKEDHRKNRLTSALFVGRLDPQTGIKTYNKAFEQIRRHFPRFTLDVYGDGPFRDQLDKRIHGKGFVESSEIDYTKYRFAFVSRYLSILEALASRRLVFAVYDNPVKEDYLKLAPFAHSIIIVHSAKELAEKIVYYTNHPREEKALVDEGYAWVKKQTWDRLVNDYLRLWKL